MVGHGGSSAGSYLADPTSPIPSHCASTVATSTLRVKTPQCTRNSYYQVMSGENEQLMEAVVTCMANIHSFVLHDCRQTKWAGDTSDEITVTQVLVVTLSTIEKFITLRSDKVCIYTHIFFHI